MERIKNHALGIFSSCAVILALFAYWITSDRNPVPIALPPAEGELSPEMQEQLAAIGYSAISDVAASAQKIPTYNRDKAQPGLNLYVSAHTTEAVLMNMEGEVVHTWSKPFDEIWPGEKNHPFSEPRNNTFFRQFRLFPNGDIILIFELFGMVKLDVDSNVLWKFEGYAHHDVDVDGEGNVHSLTKRVEYIRDDGPLKWRLYPTISTLSGDGELLRTVDVFRCFENSPYAALLLEVQEYGDLFHNNTLRVFDGSQEHRSPIFKKGNMLVSSPWFDAIYIIDPEQETVVWMLRSLFHSQHDPQLLDSGSMLIFNNRAPNNHSTLLEFDPFTQEVVWQFGGTDETHFFSGCCSTVQRLPNGNTLAAVTHGAMAFEVTPDGEIVWQFNNPATMVLNSETRAATVFELRRVLPDFPTDWLKN